MDRDQPAELLRADATAAILTVLRFVQRHSDWLSSIEQFPFVEHPGKDRLARALSLLFFLGALTDSASSKLTPRGLAMARMHFTPRVSAMLLAAQDLGVDKLACVAMGMASAGRFLFRRGRTDEEKAKATADRTALAAHFPALGDVGVGIAVWLEARASADEREWCRSHSVSLFQLRMCKRAVRNMHKSLQDKPAAAGTKPPLPTTADVKPASHPAARNDLPSVTAASFSDPSLLQCALLVGYHGNLAFLLPKRPGDPDHQPPSYFLPHCNSVARLGSSAAFVMSSDPCPPVAVFMELVESHRLFLGSLFSITAEKLDEMLPEAYRKSSVYAAFKQLNSRRQMMATPSEATTSCAIAYRQLVGTRGEGIQSRLPQLRKKFGLGKDSELIVQTNSNRRQILIMSDVVAARDAIAKDLQQELDEVAEGLANRVDEWAVPGTSVRAVIGMGGECRRLLYGPVESIIVRFSADMLASRLLEPITVVGKIPPGLFERIADVSTPAPKEEDALSNLQGPLGASRYQSKAQGRAGKGTLEKVSMAQVLAAIAYTAGGTACYSVNAWLRNLNEAQCHAHEHYIQALQAFQRRRAAHPANLTKRGRIVYRGCMLPRDLLSQYAVDGVVVWPAFTSTTTNIGVARMFGGGGGGNESQASVLFKITTDTWCPLSDVSVYPSEDEVLLPAFSAFTVLKVDAPEGSTSAPVTIVLRREHNAVQALKLHKAVPVKTESGATHRRGVPDGVGPIVITDKSLRPGLDGVSEIIQKQLRRLDPKVSVHARCDERSKAVHGRACFSDPKAAAKACALLDGALLGERQLSMVAAPVKTESLSLRNRVVVRVTAVPHKGFATLNCGTPVCAMAILRAAASQRSRSTWGSLHLVDGSTPVQLGVKQHTPKRKEDKPRPAWIVVSKIPSLWTARKLREVLAGTFKGIPLNPVISMGRDYQALVCVLSGTGIYIIYYLALK